jgi:hypothetical protein
VNSPRSHRGSSRLRGEACLATIAGVFNGETDALPVRIKDAASFLLRITWQDISMISVQEGLLTICFHSRPALCVTAEIEDIPNLIGLIRAK